MIMIVVMVFLALISIENLGWRRSSERTMKEGSADEV